MNKNTIKNEMKCKFCNNNLKSSGACKKVCSKEHECTHGPGKCHYVHLPVCNPSNDKAITAYNTKLNFKASSLVGKKVLIRYTYDGHATFECLAKVEDIYEEGCDEELDTYIMERLGSIKMVKSKFPELDQLDLEDEEAKYYLEGITTKSILTVENMPSGQQ